MKASVRICGRKFPIKFDPSTANSDVDLHCDSDGTGKITVGALGIRTNPQDVGSRLMHEIIEGILMQDRKRFTPWTRYGDGEVGANHLFLFDHDYLTDFAVKLLDALLSTGFITLRLPVIGKDAANRSRTDSAS